MLNLSQIDLSGIALLLFGCEKECLLGEWMAASQFPNRSKIRHRLHKDIFGRRGKLQSLLAVILQSLSNVCS
jgi:hypothetical protein